MRRGEVPHHLPGENPFLDEFAKKHNLPQNGVRGGAETAPLPEFMSERAGRDAGSRASGPGADRSDPRPAPAPDNEVHSLHVQGNVWMLARRPASTPRSRSVTTACSSSTR